MTKPPSTCSIDEDDVTQRIDATRNKVHRGVAGSEGHGDPVRATLASRHGFSIEALNELSRAISAGGGAMAQFSHPELGGSGQWMRNGMVMVGDMFNHRLAGRVAALCEELAPLVGASVPPAGQSPFDMVGHPPSAQEQFGLPAASGSQNGMRYAWFPAHRRLVVEGHGRRRVFDTADHAIHGVAQQQSAGGTITFTSQHGPVDLASLREVDAPANGTHVRSLDDDAGTGAGEGHDPPKSAPSVADGSSVVEAGPASSAAPTSQAQTLDLLSKLAELHARGVLTDQEFTSKKAQLLDRL
ncbi:MAG: hypothetical protein DI563_25860 [Variovorax paradoxus]|uniref:SHOCT domain-containing protein n=1 Tax=Variovorax paradoxus TaxID=34073 RepID=A0A2W5PH26_VARPD|nr:MAG: hypothetical protein DI563_25860 [Variovorax paradoxus]